MLIYPLFIVFVLLCIGIVHLQPGNAIHYKRISNTLLLIICGIIVILATFRAPSVGPDTPSYILHYFDTEDWSFKQIFSEDFLKRYSVYYSLSKVFYLAGFPWTVWFCFLEIVYIVPMYILIRRYSTDDILSILVFITTGLFLFSLTGLKQTLGMSFMMMAYLVFVEKKYIWTIIFVLLGYYSHPSTAIFLIGLGIYYFRNSRYFKYIILGLVVLAFISGEWVFTSLVDMNGDEHFETYLEEETTYTATTLIFYIALVGFSLFGYKRYKLKYPGQARTMLGMAILACALQSFASFSPNAFRLAYCYTPFMMILLPNSLNSIQNKTNSIIMYLVVVFSLCFYFLYAGRAMVYEFL